jgi:flagellar hook-basal body complex protein FliE
MGVESDVQTGGEGERRMNPSLGLNSLGNFPPGILNQLNQMTRQGPRVDDVVTTGESPQPDFKSLIMESITQVNDMQQSADMAIETLMTGGDINPAEVLTAIQKADMSFRMMQQIRNKLMDAYREIKEIRI